MAYPLFDTAYGQRALALKTARHLAPHVNQIIDRWGKAYRKLDRTIDKSAYHVMEKMYFACFKMSLEESDTGFSCNRITMAAKRLCQLQVPFDHLIMSLHLLQDSYLPYLKVIYPRKEKLVQAMVTMDFMRLSCFSAIASSYFREQYTTTDQSPQQRKLSAKLFRSYKLTLRESEVLKRMRKLGKNNMADLMKFVIRNLAD